MGRASIKRAVALIEEFQPDSPNEFRQLGLKLEYISNGMFREVYRVKGLPLVVKFPLCDGDDEGSSRAGKLHSTIEVRKIKKLAEIPELRPHLPKVYHHNRKTGVLVMKYYAGYADLLSTLVEHLGFVVTKLIKRISGVNCSDLDNRNIHQGRGDNCVFIDLGY